MYLVMTWYSCRSKYRCWFMLAGCNCTQCMCKPGLARTVVSCLLRRGLLILRRDIAMLNCQFLPKLPIPHLDTKWFFDGRVASTSTKLRDVKLAHGSLECLENVIFMSLSCGLVNAWKPSCQVLMKVSLAGARNKNWNPASAPTTLVFTWD